MIIELQKKIEQIKNTRDSTVDEQEKKIAQENILKYEKQYQDLKNEYSENNIKKIANKKGRII